MNSYRKPLCSYYSSNPADLIVELRNAYHSVARARQGAADSQVKYDRPGTKPTQKLPELTALVVPHGAACDGFHVAAHAYYELAAYLKRKTCRCLTAVLLGTEHQGTTPIALSKRDWLTPIGLAPANTAAVDYLSQQHGIPINEAPHSTEHSIENQLPFLVHAASWGWDLAAAGCIPASAGSTSSTTPPAAPARLSIVPISIGYLGAQPGLVKQYGAAVADVLQFLKSQQYRDQQHQLHEQQLQFSGVKAGSTTATVASGHEVVLIVTSDLTHAGPWYRELPPAGVKLEDYMAAQDQPVLQAIKQGSVADLMAAAAATRNSMCGLYPLGVALEALYGSSSSTISKSAGKPQLLIYIPAHMIYSRPDSTGFAALTVYSKQ